MKIINFFQNKRVSLFFLLISWLLSSTFYYYLGSTSFQKIFWLVSLLAGVIFYLDDDFEKHQTLQKQDYLISLLILLFFAPLFLMGVDVFPLQVNTDEITLANTARSFVNGDNPDPFSPLFQYFSFPAGSFYIMGKLAKLFPGPNFYAIRMSAGVIGLFALVSSYFFFRLSLNRKWALVSLLFLAMNQVVFLQSRRATMVMLTILFTTSLYFFLCEGFEKQRKLFCYVGGFILGCCWYTYASVLSAVVGWGLSFLIFVTLHRKKFLKKGVLKSTLIPLMIPVVVGCFFASTPSLISKWKHRDEVMTDYYKHQIVLFKEARNDLVQNTPDHNLWKAIRDNAIKGLGVFNNGEHDNSYDFFNPGFGFVDPFTGILIWISLILIFITGFKSHFSILSATTGFLFIWLFTGFLITKNPSYPRFLVVMSFIPLLCAHGLENFSIWIEKKFKKLSKFSLENSFAVLAILLVFYFNMNALVAYARLGDKTGNVPSAIVKLVERNAHRPEMHYYIITDNEFEFLSPWQDYWYFWISGLRGTGENVQTLRPKQFIENPHFWRQLQTPAMVFLNSRFKAMQSQNIALAIPHASINDLDENKAQSVIQF